MDATALRREAPLSAPKEPARLFVLPGQVVVAQEPAHLVTVLGSCVSVCLFDARSGVGGLNHIVFSGVPSEAESDACKWSTPAMERLVGQAIAAGARVDRLQAKVFGGAQVSPGPSGGVFRLGERNVEAALWELGLKKIPLLAKDTGGYRGRKLVFESHTGRVWVKELVRERP